ncbi:hypothetical protein [Salinispora vitiensis]|uniref:hypothetical protein n=1 Tax=Salinispora vitiensis TaxID=999544 RepID=UPI00036A9BB3|nr:hypothetical protein [Salinispora vitiensis]
MIFLACYEDAAAWRVAFAEDLPGSRATLIHVTATSTVYALRRRWLVEVPPCGDVVVIAVYTSGQSQRFAGFGCTYLGLRLGGVIADALRRTTTAKPTRWAA